MGGGFWISAKRNGAQRRNNGSRDCPPFPPVPPRAGGSRPSVAFPESPCRVFRADGGASRWIPAASPQLTFSGILGFGSGRLQSLGEGWAANGLFLERLAGGTRFPARGAARGL